jgi:hypothetical protein
MDHRQAVNGGHYEPGHLCKKLQVQRNFARMVANLTPIDGCANACGRGRVDRFEQYQK